MDAVERVRQLVAPLLAEAEVDLYDLEFAGGVLRITVDRAGGVDIGTIGSLTRSVSRAIDDVDPIPGQFTLEVSSPGLERPLRTPAHFARSVGELVSVKTRAGVPGDRRAKGTVVSADDQGFVLAPAGAAPGETRRLEFDDLERARTVFEWGPAPKPGGSRAAGAKTAPSAKKKKAAKP
ncbi:MAG: ribosome maturation factor RimP [Actinobacteria bacterium]|nr:ribosome maturation factor RimP [Actinomycetota bacterium]